MLQIILIKYFNKKLINQHRILLLTTSKKTLKIRHKKKILKKTLKKTLKIRHKNKIFKMTHKKKTFKIIQQNKIS